MSSRDQTTINVEVYRRKLTTPQEALKSLKPGQRIFIGSNCAEPQTLVEALAARSDTLSDNEIVHILTMGIAPYAERNLVECFRHNAIFIGANVRKAVETGDADYSPVFLSEAPALFRSGALPIDVALIQVSPPDEHGFCSFGVSVDVVKSAAESARFVVAEVNPQMPRTLGDSFIHVNDVDFFVESSHPILELPRKAPDETAMQIGRHIAELVEDGATLQMGIGAIPDAVLMFLHDKKDLGVHTEMFSDGLLDLARRGVVTNRRKTLHGNKAVASFCMGSRDLYQAVDNNPFFEFRPSEYVNDPFIIAQNEKMVAINSAIEVDLTGQVCADSIGTRFFSGIGGQVDFVRGAARSRGGRPIIALPSTAKSGEQSRIVPTLKPGAGVVTSRGDVHYVVTEYGVAYLHGKTIRERAMALINIAHPKFRGELMRRAKELNFIYGDQAEEANVAPHPPEMDATFSSNGRRVRVRPLRPTDEGLLKTFFYRLSEETVYHRFHGHLKSQPHADRRPLLNVDHSSHVGLAALVGPPGAEEFVAVGRYFRQAGGDSAEVAFTVRDDWKGTDVGPQLFAVLARAARAQGVKRFESLVAATDAYTLRLFTESGLSPEVRLDSGQFHVTMSL